MVVVIEFLDEEPIENIITCLNYKVDKVIFWGYKEVVERCGKSTERFLKKYCNVTDVVFKEMSHVDFKAILTNMEKEVEREMREGNSLLFDLTGGEDLILVAFGYMSAGKNLPMHFYNVRTGELIELDKKNPMRISQVAKKQNIRLNIHRYIEMQGGIVNEFCHKDSKVIREECHKADLENLWFLSQKYKKEWNRFTAGLRSFQTDTETLFVHIDYAKLNEQIKKKKIRLGKKVFRLLIEECNKLDLLCNYKCTEYGVDFEFKTEFIQSCIYETGSVLELHTYLKERDRSDDCMVGVHLDWDGIIGDRSYTDVLNEVDVLTLNGYVLTFISCKNGTVDPKAMYELDTIAERFGGKYAKKVLVAPQGVYGAYKLRADEMESEVREE